MTWIDVAIVTILALLAVMTFVSNLALPKGLVRVCDFPRVQIALLATSLGIASWFVLVPDGGPFGLVALSLAAVVVTVQVWHIAPYTPFWPVESRNASGISRKGTLKVLVSNVLQTNTNHLAVADLIRERSPDILVLMEVDETWISALRRATRDYPYKLEVALDNLYGLALYSRLELINPQAMYILRDDIPSITTICRLRNGRLIRFIAVHPEPPLPHTGTEDRDSEIIIAGQMALADEVPAILTGDFNDVAWSRTSRRFRRLSGLLDPRIGRGFYNTFNANWPILRWPLDHLFHDQHFSLVEMSRLPHVGSDHFPIYFEVALGPFDDGDEVVSAPRQADLDEARDLLDDTDHPTEDTLEPAKKNVSGEDSSGRDSLACIGD